MALAYAVIEVFVAEGARAPGRPLHVALVELVASSGFAARCVVTRGIAGAYEDGSIASGGLEAWPVNVPVKVEIVLPRGEADALLERIAPLVQDGVVTVRDVDTVVHRSATRLLPPGLRVRDVMTARPEVAREDTPLDAIVERLLGARFNALPIVDADGRPVGIVTPGDLARRAGLPVRLGLLALFERHLLDDELARLHARTASAAMTRPVVTVRDDALLDEAVRLMLEREVKRLPVVDAAGRLSGVLARFDVFRAIGGAAAERARAGLGAEAAHARAVRDVVERETETVAPDTPLLDVVARIARNPVQRVAVVDAGGRLVGLVTDRDILQRLEQRRAGVWELVGARRPFRRAHRDLLRELRARTASDVMRTDLVTVRESDAIDHAIALMAERHLKRLPVVDERGGFLGMISRNALLRAGTERRCAP